MFQKGYGLGAVCLVDFAEAHLKEAINAVSHG